MKTMILSLALSLCSLNAFAAKGDRVLTTLENGATVSLREDACYDPVTKAWGPCYVLEGEEKAAQDACIDPVTKRPEPCF